MNQDAWLTGDAYLSSIEGDARTMLDIARRLDLGAPVPTCPGWTMRDLVVHTGVVHRDKTEVVRGGWLDERPPRPDEPEGDLFGWFAEGVHDMLVVFRAADLTQPSWTWCGHDHTAMWWVRRMAHETAIHRADAEVAAGVEPMLGDELASDGVDELLDEMLVGAPPWATTAPTEGTVVLEAGSRRWPLAFGAFSGTSPHSGRVFESADMLLRASVDSPDATVTTDPSTLDLWLWGRADLPDEAVAGDATIPARIRQMASEATG